MNHPFIIYPLLLLYSIITIQTFRIITILITYVNIIFKIYWNSVQKRELFLFQSAQNTGKITGTNV